jgi:hypothetical protein
MFIACLTLSSVILLHSVDSSIVNGSRTPYELGYDHGCEDAGLAQSERYQPEGHTDEFVRGYYDGYNDCVENISLNEEEFQPQRQSIDEEPFQQPNEGGIDWIKTCNDLQITLVSSCEVLVNPDNTLTIEGERAVGCIRNGIALAGGGTFLLNLPLPLVITALQILEEPTGCGGIVEWGLIGDVEGLKGIIGSLT